MAERNFDDEYNPTEMTIHVFTLGGYEFHTKSVIHPSVFLGRSGGVEGAVQFIERLLDSTEREVFTKMVNDPDTPISSDQVGEVFSWLVEVFSDRPTAPPDTSGSGDAPTS